MPVDKGILSLVVQQLPSPVIAQKHRISVISPNIMLEAGQSEEVKFIKQSIENCMTGKDAPTIAYVTKMQPFSSRIFDVLTRQQNKSSETQKLIGFARVFSGVLRVGQKVFVMGAKHGHNGIEDIKEVEIKHLFLLMGSSLQLVESVPAGNIVGIGSLEDYIIKTGTISSSPQCPNFQTAKTISMGLIKVAIET